jgi:type IV secretory pathway VirJ component
MDPRSPGAGARVGARKPAGAFRRAWLAAAVLLGVAGGVLAAGSPFVNVPAAPETDGPVVLLLSGDGDWVAFMRSLATALAAHGSPVLGVKMRTVLGTPQTPEATAAMIATELRDRLEQWHRKDIFVVGYSRGADAAAFLVNRWPEDLRSRVRALVLIGLSERASFAFHLEDLVRNVDRPTDLLTRPEIEKLGSVPITCIRGEDEDESLCDHPTPGMRALVHAGGHRAQADDGTIDLVLDALGLEH